jgi:hypothetical protein
MDVDEEEAGLAAAEAGARLQSIFYTKGSNNYNMLLFILES